MGSSIVPQNAVATLSQVLTPTIINETKYGFNGYKSRVEGIPGPSPNANINGVTLNLSGSVVSVDDKANRAIIDFLHQWFKLPTSQIVIRQGGRGRRKIVEIARCDAQTLKLLASLETSCPAN